MGGPPLRKKKIPQKTKGKVLPLIVDFKDVTRLSLTENEVGGKGLSLAKLTDVFEDRIPIGACVTTSAYQEHIESQCRIDMNVIRYADHDTLKNVREKIKSTDLSFKTRSVLLKWLKSRDVSATSRFAVRSSGTMEDGSEQSFAGQYDTLLNVLPSLDHLEIALKSCWASLWSEHSLSYLSSSSSSFVAAPKMSVVVQLQLNPICAGTMFTINPLNACVHEMLIQAVWGLGEGQVSGRYTGHSTVLDWRNGRILSEKTTPQLKKLVCVDSQRMTVRTSKKS